MRVYVWDAKRHGIMVLPPHVNHSGVEWGLEGKAIRAGFSIVKGLSRCTAGALVSERRRKAFGDLDDLRRRVTFRKPELQNLIHVGACDGLGPTRPVMLNRLCFGRADKDQPMLFDIYRDRSVGQLPDYDRIARLKAELDVTGISFGVHPALLLPSGYVAAVRLKRWIGRHATIAGFVATARRARTGDGRVMGFVTLEDTTGLAEVSFFPDQIEQYRRICSYGGPVWVGGRVTEHLSSIGLEGAECGKVA